MGKNYHHSKVFFFFFFFWLLMFLPFVFSCLFVSFSFFFGFVLCSFCVCVWGGVYMCAFPLFPSTFSYWNTILLRWYQICDLLSQKEHKVAATQFKTDSNSLFFIMQELYMICEWTSLFCLAKINILSWFSFVFYCFLIY